MSRHLLLLLTLAGAMAAGCHRQEPEEVETQATVPVRTAAPRVGTITAYIHAAGVVEAAPGADWTVVAPQAARVATVRAAAGDTVRRGTEVVRFDAPQLRADLATRSGELAQAQARLENARRNHERLALLLEKGIASRKEIEDARKELLDAEAASRGAGEARAAAEELARQAVAVAPFDGIVAQRWHNPGDLVDAHEHVLRLVDPARLEIAAGVPAAQASRVVPGRTARVVIPGSGAEAEASARVASAPAIVDPNLGTVSVRLRLDGRIPVGTPVELEIAAEEHPGALVVPAAAIVHEGEEAAVFVVDATSHAHRRVVVLGLVNAQEAEVKSGLQASDTVVVKGLDELPDGAQVVVEKE